MRSAVPRLVSPPACGYCLHRLDGLPWTACESFSAFGVTFAIRADDAELLARVRPRLPGSRARTTAVVDHLYSICRGGEIPGTRARRYFVGYAADARFARTLDEHAFLDAVESQVRLDVATSTSTWFFVHAGAVAWNGLGIVIPGASHSGKSRLVEALVRAGATYYSDEFAVIDPDGRLHPFLKPLSLRLPSGGARRISSRDLGVDADPPPVRIGLIVSTQYTPGPAPPLEAGSAGEAVLALLGHTVRARLAPGPVLSALARAVDGAALLQGPRGDARRTAAGLLRGLEEAVRPRPAAPPSSSRPSAPPRTSRRSARPRTRRRPPSR
jgi:hypothetical protein